MKTHPITRAGLFLALFAPLGMAVQRPRPAPAPAPPPAPAQSDAEREAKAKEARAKQEREAQAQKEQEAARIKRAREEANQENRVKHAREEANQEARVKAARENAAGGAPGANADRVHAAREAERETARKMMNLEGVHRERLGRIDRLLAIYRENGDQAKLAEVEALKGRENKRYLLIIDQFKTKLGPNYAHYEPQLLAGKNRGAEPATPARPAEPGNNPPRRRPPAPANEKSGGGA
ncbi:MAG: hypothetical protein ABI054_07425 [Planctomycetota bacterium]